MGKRKVDYSVPVLRQMLDFCEHGNESSGYMKCKDFLNSCGIVTLSSMTLFHGVIHIKIPRTYTLCDPLSKLQYCVRKELNLPS